MIVLSRLVPWLLVVILLLFGWRYLIARHAKDNKWVPAYFLRYFLLLRVPIILGAILFFLPLLANTIASAYLQNLFVMRNPWQLAWIILSSTIAALMISLVFELILENSPARFSIPQLVTFSAAKRYTKQYTLTAIFLLPTWIVTIWLSVAELKIAGVIVGLVVGLLGSLGFFVAVQFMESILEKPELKQFFKKLINYFVQEYPEGYLDKDGELTNGHLLGFALSMIGLLVYALVIFFYQIEPDSMPYLGEAPALLYALLLIWIMTVIFSGATFYGDRFRIPVIVFFVLFSGLSYAIFGVDHYFRLEAIKVPSLEFNQPEKLGDFKTAVANRLKNQAGEEQRTLVVVAASGGGIQSAGWTVQVLGGLQEELGPSFTQATGLISSASGGSVGTMFFLDRFAAKQGYPYDEKVGNQQQENSLAFQNETLNLIFNSATEDWLDAVGWGLAYPDLVRAIGFPFAASKYSDRGYALEQDWQKKMKQPEATLADRRQQILKGEIPIPVFNATLVEDGRRFLITPMKFIKRDLKDLVAQSQEDDPQKRDRKALDFNTLYPGYDLRSTTAARLSATFPYVTPIARNDVPLKHNYHVADGGYFDNSGLFTLVEWLDTWLDSFSQELNIKRVLLLQINAFPESQLQATQAGYLGLWTESIGPLKVLLNVRDSTQVARNLKEAELLKNRWQGKVEIEPFIIFFPEGYNQPLSWKLTEHQKENLRRGWEEVKHRPTFREIQHLWQDKWQIPREWGG